MRIDKERIRERQPIATRLAWITIPLLVLGCATTTQRDHWTDWQAGDWHNVAPRSTTITIDSDPAGAAVVIDGVRRGYTPLSRELAYDVQERRHTRTLQRITSVRQNEFAPLVTLGTVSNAPHQSTVLLRDDSYDETREVPMVYDVTLIKPGYFPVSLDVRVPEAHDATIHRTLVPHEYLVVGPVEMEESIEQSPPLFTWLYYRFFSSPIDARQYEILAQRVLRHFAASLSESGEFAAVSQSSPESADIPIARARVQVELGAQSVVMRGALTSPLVLGNRTVYREVRADSHGAFLDSLPAYCSELTEMLLQPYRAACAGDRQNQPELMNHDSDAKP